MRRHASSLAARPAVVAGLACALAAGACARSSQGPLPPWEPVPEPPGDAVESVVVLIGDPGQSAFDRAPVLSDIEREVERWAGRVPGDSAVAVIVLGDIVYPAGLRDPGSPEFPEDSLRLMAQVDMVDGPNARDRNAVAWFIAGNHDWGEARGVAGVRRIRNLDEFLERARERTGVHVDLVPPAGDPGPEIVDMGANLRIILLDSAWWLLAADPAAKAALMDRVEAAIGDAGRREVIIAMHHPWRTAGSHGGTMKFWETFGIRWLLHKTGSLLQDVNSRPMQDIRRYFEDMFERQGPPLLFAGGHDHSLQVMEGVEPDEPRWIVVSGTGTKVTEVGDAPGMRFRVEKAGYMTLVTLRNGGVILYVRGADEEWLACPHDDHPDVEPCMAAAKDAFSNLFSIRLK